MESGCLCLQKGLFQARLGKGPSVRTGLSQWGPRTRARQVEGSRRGAGRGGGSTTSHTHSFVICTTFSMPLYPAATKCSVYWCILMDSSHSATVRKGIPSEPLVLGRRMETLWRQEGAWPFRGCSWLHLGGGEQLWECPCPGWLSNPM